MYTFDEPTDLVNYNSVFQSGKDLAALLDVSPAAITSAVKKGHKCCGYPVAEWAEFSDSGRTKGYHVPDYLIEENEESEIDKNQKQWANPEKMANEDLNSELIKLNSTNNKATQVDEPEENVNKQENQQPNYSILPENQDYARPATSVALSSTVNTALKQDTPQSRAVIAASVTGLGALTGQMVSDSAKGAAVGATVGFGVYLIAHWYAERNQPQPKQQNQQHYNRAKQDLVDQYVNKAKSSGFVN